MSDQVKREKFLFSVGNLDFAQQTSNNPTAIPAPTLHRPASSPWWVQLLWSPSLVLPVPPSSPLGIWGPQGPGRGHPLAPLGCAGLKRSCRSHSRWSFKIPESSLSRGRLTKRCGTPGRPARTPVGSLTCTHPTCPNLRRGEPVSQPPTPAPPVSRASLGAGERRALAPGSPSCQPTPSHTRAPLPAPGAHLRAPPASLPESAAVTAGSAAAAAASQRGGGGGERARA